MKAVREYTRHLRQRDRGPASTVIGNSLDTTTAPVPLSCIECRRSWLDGAERWRLKVTDDEPAETVAYCAQCATREFGPTHA